MFPDNENTKTIKKTLFWIMLENHCRGRNRKRETDRRIGRDGWGACRSYDDNDDDDAAYFDI